MWFLKLIRALYWLKGVITTVFLQRHYGVPRTRRTLVLHNAPCLHRLRIDEAVGPPPVALRDAIIYQGSGTSCTS